MKLIILRDNRKDVYGGVELKICSIVERCQTSNIQVIVVTTKISKKFRTKLSEYKCEVVTFERLQIFNLIYLFFILKPDFVQTHQLRDSILSRMCKLLIIWRKTYLIQRIHTHLDGYIENRLKKYYWKIFDKLTFPLVDICLCISEKLKIELSYLGRCGEKKIIVLENGTKLPRNRPQKRSYDRKYNTACIVGDVSKRKNQLETINLLNDQSRITTLHVCGHVNPEMDAEFFECLGKSKINIKYHGFLNFDSLHEIYSECDFIILLSKFEGVPTVLFEGRFHGLIPIFSNAGSTSSYIRNNYDGVIIEQQSFQKLPKIFDSLTDEECQTLSENSYKAFREAFNEKSMTDAFMNLYQCKNG